MHILNSIRDGVYGSRRREPLAIDIENHLDSMPGADHLNWRSSIVDLMTLIGVDASRDAREALAQELGYDGPLDGSRAMDNWLHARVLADLAAHGGGVRP